MKTLLVDNGSTLLSKLELLVPGTMEVKSWNDLKDVDADGYDLIVLSGSSGFPVVGNEDKLRDELKMIQDRRTPLIGICYGTELIGAAYGGTLQKDPERHQGMVEVRVTRPEPLFGGRMTLKVYESHRWRLASAPENFIVLAESDHGIEAIRHKTLPLYGFQFHPENFVDKGEGDEIFLNLVRSF